MSPGHTLIPGSTWFYYSTPGYPRWVSPKNVFFFQGIPQTSSINREHREHDDQLVDETNIDFGVS